MLDAVKKCPGLCAMGALVIGGFILLESSGWARGGSRAPQRIDPKQIRSSSPGSWTYLYWTHGSRGK